MCLHLKETFISLHVVISLTYFGERVFTYITILVTYLNPKIVGYIQSIHVVSKNIIEISLLWEYLAPREGCNAGKCKRKEKKNKIGRKMYDGRDERPGYIIERKSICIVAKS